MKIFLKSIDDIPINQEFDGLGKMIEFFIEWVQDAKEDEILQNQIWEND